MVHTELFYVGCKKDNYEHIWGWKGEGEGKQTRTSSESHPQSWTGSKPICGAVERSIDVNFGNMGESSSSSSALR